MNIIIIIIYRFVGPAARWWKPGEFSSVPILYYIIYVLSRTLGTALFCTRYYNYYYYYYYYYYHYVTRQRRFPSRARIIYNNNNNSVHSTQNPTRTPQSENNVCIRAAVVISTI